MSLEPIAILVFRVRQVGIVAALKFSHLDNNKVKLLKGFLFISSKTMLGSQNTFDLISMKNDEI